MNTITVLFTRRKWNPVSWLIRWAMPRSRFAFALSSHALIVDGETCLEATMLHGVREVPRTLALKGQTIVKQTQYTVPDAKAGLAWGRAQVCVYEPNLNPLLPKRVRRAAVAILRLRRNNYDFKGAFGLSLAPDRDWSEEDCWFCYELVAGVLRAAGRPLFANLSHVGETALMAINP